MSLPSIDLRPATQADVAGLVHLLRRSWLVSWGPELPFEAVQRFAVRDPARVHAEADWAAFMVAARGRDVVGMSRVAGDAVDELNADPGA